MKLPQFGFGFLTGQPSYHSVEQGEFLLSGEKPANPQAHRNTYLSGSWKSACLLLLLCTNVVTIVGLLWSPGGQEGIPEVYAKVDSIKTTWTKFWWWTEYSDSNHTTTNELWDAILPSHGFVAMDLQWAAGRNWPETMRLPSDPSKGVYLLEAYHQLHCLRMIRKTFWEAYTRKPYTYQPSPHFEHCFDTLRQAIMCNADNTPLYTFGDNTAGDGQLHRCHNWDELRVFATENTACYRDTIEDVLLKEHFGFCDDGSDGLHWAEDSEM
ncbi:hypothetical protein BDV95DRAFT_592708 [Massariosphaeria phaeospora]|uniref:Cyclochlorotine biosynthesis protein O n=1 Tax=Massariosphaeria phaeospora TaxID=100035 RepID=A0A7C8MB13_9PLEO|nr:hypothetical protein BDV95DRAFT_592708 [Massariosphaeria phaeospora]